MFGLVILGLVVCGGVYKRKSVKEAYYNFRQLNQLVETQYSNPVKVLWVSSTIVGKMYWFRFLQWLNNSLNYRNDKTLELTYTYKEKLYKIITETGKGPSRILSVEDEKGVNITNTVLPYFGPNQDWHGREFKPVFWNCEKLIFELTNTSEKKIFDKNDTIIV